VLIGALSGGKATTNLISSGVKGAGITSLAPAAIAETITSNVLGATLGNVVGQVISIAFSDETFADDFSGKEVLQAGIIGVISSIAPAAVAPARAAVVETATDVAIGDTVIGAASFLTGEVASDLMEEND